MGQLGNMLIFVGIFIVIIFVLLLLLNLIVGGDLSIATLGVTILFLFGLILMTFTLMRRFK